MTEILDRETLRQLFNAKPRYWRDPDFDRTIELANQGKHGSYMKLKRVMKEARNDDRLCPRPVR